MNMTWRVSFEDKRVGDFVFIEDSSGKIWVWNLSVNDDNQKNGIGSEIIRQAVEYYGAVYFYTGTRAELRNSEWSYDSRYLSEEGVVLLNQSIRKGIIKKDWAINPYEEKGQY